ncbi:LOW QUALITY PROTEIN: hypothetical protein TorRG33x02_168190 [Trema orientale]|uniref:Uncharacterized protein n=1 Tax=Trema orientale TaxID=63057 RepID=A0A2P5EP49_TREOI|nr:LOW QUALITY PROTEIN: hypothetical protein TorRG33x02_168190 [Trema orientale]
MEKDPMFQTALLSNGSGTSAGSEIKGGKESREMVGDGALFGETDFGAAAAGDFIAGEGAGDGAMADPINTKAINRIRMRVIELELELERAIAEKVKL